MDSKALSLTDFKVLFGADGELPEPCIKFINQHNWEYSQLIGEELDVLVEAFLNRINKKDLSIVMPDDKSRWIRGWNENLKDFMASSGNPELLAPKYIRPYSPVRLFGNFIKTTEPDFEMNWYRVFQQWLFATYLKPYDTIFEFGCGSCINVASITKMFPEKKIVALDWAEPSYKIANAMRSIHGWNTEGRLFDFFAPDYSLNIPQNSVVLTIGALEQTSTLHEGFIDFLLKKKPALCIFIEPVYDWYDPSNLADYLAIRAHDVRNFWKGFHARLYELEKNSRVEIIKQKRAYFGSLMLEGYSQTIWRPL